MYRLRITRKDGRVTTFPLEDSKILIGRDKRNQLVLPDTSVSRIHAQIIRTKRGYLLGDMGSFNGTKVNDKPVQRVFLKPNDEIMIGPNKIVFQSADDKNLSPVDTLILSVEDASEDQDQKIVKSSPLEGAEKDATIVTALSLKDLDLKSTFSVPSGEKSDDDTARLDIKSLERSYKVLYILYEISRQMNLMHDFNELSKKFMDLLFTVIDADYGFILLISDDDNKDLVPIVVKYKDSMAENKGRLRISRTLINKVIADKVALLTSNAMKDSRLGGAQSLFMAQIRSAMCVPIWRKEQIIGVIQLDSIRLDNQFTEEDLELLKAIGNHISVILEQASLYDQIREEERMRSRLERFHSPQVIDYIIKSGQKTKDLFMEARHVTATILFLDIIGFTSLSERVSAMEITLILNRFFSKMTEVIFKHDGTLDKFLGDGLMAVFGAPMEKQDDAKRAIRAAKEMKQLLSNIMNHATPDKQFKIRIGINTGKVVAGNIGAPKRSDYTVIGDPVNTASRIETLAEPNQILIGQKTYELVKADFNLREVGLKRVKGKAKEILVYEVLD